MQCFKVCVPSSSSELDSVPMKLKDTVHRLPLRLTPATGAGKHGVRRRQTAELRPRRERRLVHGSGPRVDAPAAGAPQRGRSILQVLWLSVSTERDGPKSWLPLRSGRRACGSNVRDGKRIRVRCHIQAVGGSSWHGIKADNTINS